jgi:hypothetical protein
MVHSGRTSTGGVTPPGARRSASQADSADIMRAGGLGAGSVLVGSVPADSARWGMDRDTDTDPTTIASAAAGPVPVGDAGAAGGRAVPVDHGVAVALGRGVPASALVARGSDRAADDRTGSSPVASFAT